MLIRPLPSVCTKTSCPLRPSLVFAMVQKCQRRDDMDIVLPRPEALSYVSAAQWLGLIKRAAHAVYRDEQINLQHVGNKVRRLIDQHIEALNVRQLVEPISITDEGFARFCRTQTMARRKWQQVLKASTP